MQTVLFYRPGDLKPQLQTPLGTRSRPSAEHGTYTGPEGATVDTLTLSNKFILTETTTGPILLDRL